jgi:hypothetical protein
MVLGPDGVRGLVVSLSAGLIAGCLAASLRFHLGLPGHKALFWMTPVIAARLLGRCRIGATAGALTAAFVSIGLGGNLAGDAMGLPLVGAAGALIDACIIRLEKRKASALATITAVAFSAMLANLICCAKRLLVPAGIAPQDIVNGADLLLRPISYGFFGFLAGFIAAIGVHLTRRRRPDGRCGEGVPPLRREAILASLRRATTRPSRVKCKGKMPSPRATNMP